MPPPPSLQVAQSIGPVVMVKRLASGQKFHRVMSEFKHHTLHSGSKHGKTVTNPRQAVAIAYSEQRAANRHTRRRK